MSVWLFDANAVSLALRGDRPTLARLAATRVGSIRVSAISVGEIAVGLARLPAARRLYNAVREFLLRVDIMPWDEAVAWCCGRLREEMRAAGLSLSPLDMQIAAQALAADLVLVSADRAFRNVPGLSTEDWSAAAPRASLATGGEAKARSIRARSA